MADTEQATKPENTVTIEEVGPCKKKIIVEIPEEAIKSATDEQYETLRKEAVVPGFRKGHAPRRLLEKRFGKETSEQIKLKLLADASDAAVKDKELDILGEPDIDFENIELPESGPLKFDFELEVRPEFELPELKAIPVEKKKLEVTDDQIEQEIEQLQKYAGLWTPREDGQVQLDDQIIADVVFKAEGEEKDHRQDNVEVYVRQNGFVAGIAVEKLDQLLAKAKAGDVRETTVDVPKTHFKEEYRGKKVHLQITIKDIKWLKPAPLDDDFLKRFGAEDEKELREKLQDTLHGRLERQARREMTEQIYKYMLDNTNLELPLDIVADQAANLLQRQYASLLWQGLSREQVDQQMEQLRAGSEEQAKQQLKTFFIMDKVADKLNIEVSEEEINGHIAQLAIQRGQRPERLREQMVRDGSLGQFRLQVREDKCVAKLLESAKIKEVQPQKKTQKAKKTSKTKRGETGKTDKTAVAKKRRPVRRKKIAKEETGQ